MKEGSQREFQVTANVDSKSVFDLIHGENLTGAEKEASLDLLVCKDAWLSLDTDDGELRWVPHELNPGDSSACSVEAQERPIERNGYRFNGLT
eukprot:8602-Amphidinium_carterae.1